MIFSANTFSYYLFICVFFNMSFWFIIDYSDETFWLFVNLWCSKCFNTAFAIFHGQRCSWFLSFLQHCPCNAVASFTIRSFRFSFFITLVTHWSFCSMLLILLFYYYYYYYYLMIQFLNSSQIPSCPLSSISIITIV